MKHFHSKTMLAVLFALLLTAGAALGANISGTITTTLTITGTNQLTGNVTCTVPGGAPCLAFGADNTELSLNGFVITGDNASLTACTAGTNQTAIDTAKHNNARIHGPGLITKFTGNGVFLSGSFSEVDHVAITAICFNGIIVGDSPPSGGNNNVFDNSISRFSLPPEGANGIAVLGTGSNQIQQNSITGGGSNGFGIIAVTSSDHNTIAGNNVSANALGIFIWSDSLFNVVQGNQTLGNDVNADIQDPNPAHSNTYFGNLCQISFGPGAPACPGTIPDYLIGNPILLFLFP